MLSCCAVCLRHCLRLLFSSCRSAFCCVCPWLSCCVVPVLSALCGVVLRCAVALALCCSCGLRCFWCLVLWCVAVCCASFLWCAVVRYWVWFSAVVFWWRVLVSLSLSGRLACFPVVGWLAAALCSSVLCPVVLCCRVVLCRGILVFLCGAVCVCCCFFPFKLIANPVKISFPFL